MNRNRLKFIGFFAFFAFFTVAPLLTKDPYYLHILITIGLNIILALSLWIIIMTGQLNLGHAAFMAIGGYASALMVMKGGLSFWLALPLSGLIAMLIALLVGPILLRTKMIYFAIITFAFCEFLLLLFVNLPSLFGGWQGILNIPRPNPIGSIKFTSEVPFYYLMLLLLVVTFLICYSISVSQIGNIFRAIAEDDKLAESIGINIMRYKVLAFIIGSFFAGLVGCFYVYYFTTANPRYFTVWKSVDALVYVVVGGAGSIAGPMIGAIFLTIIPEMLRAMHAWELVLYGGLLILIILFLPGGLLTLPRLLFSRVRLPRIGKGFVSEEYHCGFQNRGK